MGKLIVVDGDKVEGTDKHNVAGLATNPAPPPPPTVPYKGTASFDYKGRMADQLSNFVSIGGKAVATVGSKSQLNPGENTPAGKHHGMQGSNFLPPTPSPIASSLSITDPIGEGTPSAISGSKLVSIDGEAVLLDGDKIDTCDGLSIPMNSTVSAENQDFVSCST